ncbi:outer dynein arm-docking complex subunit 4-like isoform X4 [Mercenaria mercenaria]|uniref:outer dynein arm-docking complex subunit 4-like isoform X4 n=1 Tax=Mercenaria mercenaria TaxID=6596 RepID=UPI00234E3FEC|nr:outer dynein arm-docking complex subunit 4-like isoform X4 [Mercenaria mercenaria]
MPRGRGGENGSENQEGVVSFETLRDEGNHFVHVQQYHKAVESFTKALELKPDDCQCLVIRSKCHLQLGNAEASLADAELALEQESEQPLVKGLYQKAEALYQKGDFETALIFYHRGNKLRPELQEFRLGIQKSQEAINNSIGSPDSVKLEANRGDMSYFYKQEEEQKAKDLEKLQRKQAEKEAKKQQKGSYQKPTAKKEERKERDAPKGSGDAKTVKQLLGDLFCDKEYLEKLLKDQSLTGNTKRNDMSRDIKDKVCDGLEYLHNRAEFWRQQKPMYARKRDKDRQREEWNKSRRSGRGNMEKVLRNLEEIDEAQTQGKHQESLEKAKNTLTIVQNASDDEIQNKPELMASLYSSIGNCYLELNKLNQAMDYHNRDLDIAREYNLEDAKSRALDNLGRVHARKGEYEKAIEVWQEKIPSSKSPLESTWLYHEIGRCYLEIGKYSEARDYGEKSLMAAREADDGGWQLHASVLCAQSEVKLCDYQSAADSFEKALELARQQKDEAAEQAINKALDEVNEKIVRGVKEGDGDEDEQAGKRKEPSPPPKQPTPPPKEPTPEPPRTKSVSIKEEVEEAQQEDQVEEEPQQQQQQQQDTVPASSPEPQIEVEQQVEQQETSQQQQQQQQQEVPEQEPTTIDEGESARNKTSPEPTNTDKEQTDKEQTDKEQTDDDGKHWF